MSSGLVHMYCGDGKGKTTAAVGLAVRALGHGIPVCFAQFMKPGDATELKALHSLGAHVISGAQTKFSAQMTGDERAAAREANEAILDESLAWVDATLPTDGKARGRSESFAVNVGNDAPCALLMVEGEDDTPCILLVLDEVVSACAKGFVPSEKVEQLLADKPDGLEIVLTGRNPQPGMLEHADYVTEMSCHKHPYEQGIPAREGIEY